MGESARQIPLSVQVKLSLETHLSFLSHVSLSSGWACGVFNISLLNCPKLRKRRRRQWHHTQVLLPGKSHGWRSLVGCGPWGRWESDTTERLHFHFSLSHIGEGNGNPLQCSCLENPRDGGAWWTAVYGIAQSRTRLKRLSSSRERGQGSSQTPVVTMHFQGKHWRNILCGLALSPLLSDMHLTSHLNGWTYLSNAIHWALL